MRRALFAREFRTALVPNLVTVGAILATLVSLERLFGPRLGRAEDICGVTDVGLLVFLVVSGFISGERSFSTELKESRILFLSSLPISRGWSWLTIVSARLLAGVASLALVIAIRRPLLEDSRLHWPDIGMGAAVVLFGYILFFSAGTLFALLFRRTLFSYAAGFLFLGLLLSETLFSAFYSAMPLQLAVLGMVPEVLDSLSLPLLLLAALCLSLLLGSSLVLSCRFFVRGEIGNPKRRIRNQILCAMTATAYLGFVFSVAASPRLASLQGTWSRTTIINLALPSGVSPDGRYLFVSESLGRRPFMTRVSIVATGSGLITSQSVYGGAWWGFWSVGAGDVLNLLVLNNSPLDRWGYLVPGSVDWVRLSPQGKEISKLHLIGVKEARILAGGRALVVQREGSLGKILLLDGSSGRSSEVTRTPLDGQLIVNDNGEAALVYFDNVLLPRRAWVIDSMAREVRIPQASLKTPYVLFGEVFGSTVEAQNALLQRFGQPLTSEGTTVRGSFLLPNPSRTPIFTKPRGLYYLEERTFGSRVLWVRSTAPEGKWVKLPDIRPDPTPTGVETLDGYIDFSSGSGAFSSADGDIRRFFVYDPRIGVILESEGCAPRNKSFLTVDRTPDFKGILIRLTCIAESSWLPKIFKYLPGSREVRAIKTIPNAELAPLYLDERGLGIWPTPDGEIWRSFPGIKDLRLWPPSHS